MMLFAAGCGHVRMGFPSVTTTVDDRGEWSVSGGGHLGRGTSDGLHADWDPGFSLLAYAHGGSDGAPFFETTLDPQFSLMPPRWTGVGFHVGPNIGVRTEEEGVALLLGGRLTLAYYVGGSDAAFGVAISLAYAARVETSDDLPTGHQLSLTLALDGGIQAPGAGLCVIFGCSP